MASPFFTATCAFAVVLRLTTDVFWGKRYEYPPSEGVHLWLRSILSGAALGIALWLAGRFAGFVEMLCQDVSVTLVDLMVAVTLPAVIIAAAMLEAGKVFAWSLASSKGVWWKALGCMGVIVASGLSCIAVLSRSVS